MAPATHLPPHPSPSPLSQVTPTSTPPLPETQHRHKLWRSRDWIPSTSLTTLRHLEHQLTSFPLDSPPLSHPVFSDPRLWEEEEEEEEEGGWVWQGVWSKCLFFLPIFLTLDGYFKHVFVLHVYHPIMLLWSHTLLLWSRRLSYSEFIVHLPSHMLMKLMNELKLCVCACLRKLRLLGVYLIVGTYMYVYRLL